MFGHLTRAPLPAGPAHRQDQSAYPAFCELAVRLYTPNLHNLGAKSSIVSGLHLKYSRFLETRARDRARSALRGVGAVLARLLQGSGSRCLISKTGECPALAGRSMLLFQ